MQLMVGDGSEQDHCRVGSSEIVEPEELAITRDHCRVGSSEMVDGGDDPDRADHCRVGSSEMEEQRNALGL